MQSSAAIRQLLRAFDPSEPLPFQDNRYVDCDPARRSSSSIMSLARCIESASRYTCQILSGNKGCGKTTELFRLEGRMSQPEYVVICCEIDNFISLNHIRQADILLATANAIFSWADKKKIGLNSERMATLVTELFPSLGIPGSQASSLLALVNGIIKRVNRDFALRQIAQAFFQKRTADLVDGINETVHELTAELGRQQQSSQPKLILVLDSLDRVPAYNDSGEPTFSRLFMDPCAVYRSLDCHLILTLPPRLIHSSLAGRLPAYYPDSLPCVIPNIAVRRRDDELDLVGIECMREIIAKRCSYVNQNTHDCFESDETVTELVLASGGYCRQLLLLVRECLNMAPSIPIRLDTAVSAIRNVARFFERTTASKSEWNLLARLHHSKNLDSDEGHLNLIENLLVFEYHGADGGVWYDVNPLLKISTRFQPS